MSRFSTGLRLSRHEDFPARRCGLAGGGRPAAQAQERAGWSRQPQGRAFRPRLAEPAPGPDREQRLQRLDQRHLLRRRRRRVVLDRQPQDPGGLRRRHARATSTATSPSSSAAQTPRTSSRRDDAASRAWPIAQQYQFFRNQWFHPHVGGGVDIARETTTEEYEPVFVFDPVTRVDAADLAGAHRGTGASDHRAAVRRNRVQGLHDAARVLHRRHCA